MATFTDIPDEVEETIRQRADEVLAEELAKAFPGRELKLTRTGASYRIHGNLKLG